MGPLLPRSLTTPVHRLARAIANWQHGVVPELEAATLRGFERLDREAQARRSFALLQRVVARAYETVPFYQRRFATAGLSPRALVRPRDFAAFPLLSKQDLRTNPTALVSRKTGWLPARWNATGGSTGTPVRFRDSAEASAFALANEHRTWRWYGVPLGSPIAVIWGADRDVAPDESAGELKNRILGRCALNAFALDDDRCRAFAAILERFDPAIVYGYATALARFARFLRTRSTPCRVRPIAIRATAEMLSDADRALIEQTLQAPVFNYYGARDAGPIAGECHARSGMHVFTDVTWVEILRADGSACAPGEVGEVVITKLHEHGMPLIRYGTGDRAAWLDRACRCGRTLPLLSSLHGRVGDFVRAPAGHDIHGEFFAHLFYGVGGVARFQVRQPTPTSLQILVEPAGTPDAVALERVRTASAERFGARRADDVELCIVPSIAPSPSGKHRFVLPYEPAR
ncbi:MAG: Coenzyme synthetase [bacterium]|nr:Coenzyme synthetase [bacterium]